MDNQNCNIPDCVKELSLLKSLIYTLELKLKNLGLENLKDVAYCLNPKIGDTLIYNGSTWVAEKGSGGGGSNVDVESLLSAGNPIAKITVDGEEHIINESVVSVNPLINEGTSIAEITVNGTTHTIKLAPGGEGNLDNIKVNNITGTVNNKIAEVTVTGNDVEVSTFEEPDKTNEELEIESSDKVTEALAKLLKALKDDEAAVTLAFMSVENATGFNDNLEYVPEEAGTLLENAENLLDADAILMNNLVPLIQFKALVLDVNKIVFTGGTSGVVKIGTNALNTNEGHRIAIPYEGNCTNVTYRFPVSEYAEGESYWTKDLVLEKLESHLLPPLIHKGRVITFEVSEKVWEWWLYVGPMDGDSLPDNWRATTNWKKLNISYA